MNRDEKKKLRKKQNKISLIIIGIQALMILENNRKNKKRNLISTNRL